MSSPKGPDPRRVEELFDALLDLDPAEAARALDAACAGDRALHAAVAALLDHDRIPARELRPPDPAAIAAVIRQARLGATTVPEHDGPEPSRDPAQLGRFFVLRRLGAGGMGVVYVGYDELLDRRVALKLLRRGRSGAALILREAQALARLAHPNVVAVHEVGEHEGRIFLAMELVDGPSLEAWLEARPPLLEVLGVFLQAGRGLAAAHEAGLVHRDFKPDNALLGKDGRVRVVDFGIAALAEPDHDAAAIAGPARGEDRSPRALTQAGAIVGTPAYMPPERLRGERATAQSDQFAFCVSLYRAAYGVTPFPARDLDELLRGVLEGEARPPPPQATAPAWLWPLLRRGLAPDPAARFPSMDALLAAIEASIPRPSDLERAALRRERLQLAGLIGLTSLGFGAYVATHDLAATFAPRYAMVAFGLVALLSVGAALFVLRRRLFQNRYGRRIAAIFLATPLAWLPHRLIGVRLGTPPLHVLTVDLLLMGTVFATAGITFEGWMGWIALVALAGAAASALAPGIAPFVMLVANLAAVLIAALRWRRE